jgi:hypothetical protein
MQPPPPGPRFLTLAGGPHTREADLVRCVRAGSMNVIASQ